MKALKANMNYKAFAENYDVKKGELLLVSDEPVDTDLRIVTTKRAEVIKATRYEGKLLVEEIDYELPKKEVVIETANIDTDKVETAVIKKKSKKVK